MNREDEVAANVETGERQSAGDAAGSDDKVNKQLRVAFDDLLRPSPEQNSGGGAWIALRRALVVSMARLLIVSVQSKAGRKGDLHEGLSASCSLFVSVLQLPWLGNLTARQSSRCSRQRLRNLDGHQRPSR
jgi:hypothetical protein